jgi:hypothetical protein
LAGLAFINPRLACGHRKVKHELAKKIFPYWNFKEYKPLWITGHSLGGSLGIITAFRLAKLGIPVKGIITFGAAQAGNKVFVKLMEGVFAQDQVNKNVLRFVNGNDGPAILTGVIGLSHVGYSTYIDNAQTFHFHQEEEDSDLEQMLTVYPGNQSVSYYSSSRPEAMPWPDQVELGQTVKDHLMADTYLKHIEKFVFGGPAAGCKI